MAALPGAPLPRRLVHHDMHDTEPQDGAPGAQPGQIVILNGTPRSGKSSIAAIIHETWDGIWMNLGVDGFMRMTPQRYRPGIGLRPGGERPDLEPTIITLYLAMYRS